MPAVLVGIDLSVLLAVLVAIGVITLIAYIIGGIVKLLDVGILGVHPFRSIGNALENTLVAGCNSLISDLGTVAQNLWKGVTWSVNELVQGLRDLADGADNAFGYLWNTALPNYVGSWAAAVNTVLGLIPSPYATVAAWIISEAHIAEARISGAISALETRMGFAIGDAIAVSNTGIYREINSVHSQVSAEIIAMGKSAISVGDSAIADLRKLENTAIAGIESTAGATAQDIRDMLGKLNPADVAGLIASVPIITALVQTLEAETGLENSSCRSKVKELCATDPGLWTQLLAGLAPLGLAFSLREVVELARPMMAATKDAIEEMAS